MSQLRYFVFIIALIGSIFFSPAGGKQNSSPQVAFAASDPVIAAAGDIACDPANPHFNGGNGDSNNCRQKSTSDLLVNPDVVAVLPLGDVQYYCGGYAAFQQSYDLSWGRVKPITHPVVGNHEYIHSTPDTTGWTDCGDSNKDAAGYFNYFGTAAGNQGQGYYSYDIGTWHLIALNSNCGDAGGCGPDSPQYKSLQADLASHTNFCTLAYWHIPLFSSGGRASPNTQAFWQLLYNNNVDLILNGHDHIYERFAPQAPNGSLDIMRGIREFIVGTGGADHTDIPNGIIAANSEVQNIDTYGVLKLTLHPTSYDWQFVPEAGKTFTDVGTGACHDATPDTAPPSAPENLTASIVSGNEVKLNWTAATDNIAVVGYQVFRNGVQIATATTNSYVDTTTQPQTAYTYSVVAVDGVGLTSGPSNTVTVTPYGLFNDDFESNGLSRWTTVTNLAVQSQEVFGGNYAARGISNSLPAYAYKQLSVAQNDLYYRINFKIINQVQTMNLLKVRTPARLSIFAIFVANDGRLGSRNDIAGLSTFSSTNVTKGSWHELQVHVSINGSASQAEVWLDGNRVSTLSKPEAFGANQVGYLQLGENASGANFDVAYDNVTADTQFIGSNSVPTITPTPTMTGTATSTPTSTATNTLTPTFTPTFTPTATNTSTPTTTATQTPTFTPTATPTSTFTPTPQNSIVFSDGFETGNFSQWTNNQGLVVQNQQVASGNYAARGVGIAGGGATYARKQLATPQSDLYYRIRFKVISQGANTVNLMKFRTSANISILSVSINNYGQLSYRNDIAGTSVNSTVSVSQGNWQTLQVHVRIADTTSQTEVWYNDVLVPILSRTEPFGTNPIGFLQLGENTAGLTYDIAFDDVAASLSFVGSSIPTPTYTPTNTVTSTLTATKTPTNTPTATQTPTSTSTPTPTVTSQPVLTFISLADTYVQSDTPTTNYGSSTQIVTDNSPVRNMLLKFMVSGVGTQTIRSAKLRLYCVDPSPFGGEFHRVTDTGWNEGTVNWNTAPSADSNILASLGRVSMNTWYEVDVTSLVNGDGSYSLKVSSTNADGAYYSTKEGTTGFAPQLVVTISQ